MIFKPPSELSCKPEYGKPPPLFRLKSGPGKNRRDSPRDVCLVTDVLVLQRDFVISWERNRRSQPRFFSKRQPGSLRQLEEETQADEGNRSGRELQPNAHLYQAESGKHPAPHRARSGGGCPSGRDGQASLTSRA